MYAFAVSLHLKLLYKWEQEFNVAHSHKTTTVYETNILFVTWHHLCPPVGAWRVTWAHTHNWKVSFPFSSTTHMTFLVDQVHATATTYISAGFLKKVISYTGSRG